MDFNSTDTRESMGDPRADLLADGSSGSSFIVPRSSLLPPPLPLPKSNIVIRPGVLSDVPFLDALQKQHTKQVGWMPRAQFEGKIRAGHVLVAEEAGGGQPAAGGEESERHLQPAAGCLPPAPTPVGYCIGNDQYFKRDDVGIIYQMNVLPGRQRGLVGAMLLKAMFEKSAWGCKLFCCWCAQDIEANRFWEAMGFVPLAFRTGGEKKGPKGMARTHIFWQKRIRAGDTSTPWWFPSQTTGGSMRSDRIVLPIPPGTHWSDAKPTVLPGDRQGGESASRLLIGALDDSSTTRRLADSPKPKRVRKAKIVKETAKPAPPAPVRPAEVLGGGLWFAPAVTETAISIVAASAVTAIDETTPAKAKTPRTKAKNDPRLVAAARELRDRWLEQVNGGESDLLLLIGREKYAVSRAGGEETLSIVSVRASMPLIDVIDVPTLPSSLAA